MEQHEQSEQELTERAVQLKHEGRSVRQIAEALNVSPSKAFRLTKQTDEAETGGETLETPPNVTFDDLEREVAHALISSDTEHLTALLHRLLEQQAVQDARLAELRATQARAEQRLTDATATLAQVTDRLARIRLEEAKSESRADYVEATSIVEHAEQSAFPFSTLVSRIQARLRTLETTRQKEEAEALMREAASMLESAKKRFLRTLAEVRERVSRAPLNENIISPSVPLDNVIEAIGRLRVGGVPARNLDEQVTVRVLRNGYKGCSIGETLTSSWRLVQDGIWRGEAEVI